MTEEIHALLDENRRLRKEVRELRDRVDAFERSRWWRVHPRSLVGRLRRQASSEPVTNAVRDPVSATDADSIDTRFREEILERGEFSRDSFTRAIRALDPVVAPLSGRAADVLEIGSFEGLSACYFLWRLPDAEVTCIDTFRGTLGSDPALHGTGLESRFDANAARVGGARAHKIVGDSRRVLLDLLEEGREFDLVYVDGSHFGLDVLADAALSWRLLRAGGTMAFDDYEWNDRGEDNLLRPGPAIDAFLGLLEGKHDVVSKGAQVVVRKR